MSLRRVNNILLTLIILINGYLIVAPLLPRVTFWWNGRQHVQQKLEKKVAHATTPQDIPKENRLIIPSMQLDEQIFDGPDSRTLNSGPWRRPATSTPDKGSNTVIAGHRYTYTNPRGSFYYLDKVKIGDEMAIFWQGKKYVYKTVNVLEVKPDQTSVEAPTDDSRLTLYTCTPLWLPKDRLVIVAELEKS